MAATWLLVHSPLVGPLTWTLVADQLRRRGEAAFVPTIDQATAAPFWRHHAQSAAAQVPSRSESAARYSYRRRSERSNAPSSNVVYVAHSGAGALLPAIRDLARARPAAYVFVDAGLPGSGAPLDSPFGDNLRSLYARGERFPHWSDAALTPIVPDPNLRARLLAELRPQPFDFWAEVPPALDGWPDAPCAYLRFSAPYLDAATEAARRGWPVQTLEGSHFHMLVDPCAVADALQHLVAASLRL